MLILLSNDDGIHAAGLLALKQALEPHAEVYVVAPEQEKSGTGHGITTHKPLRPKKVALADGSTGWSVNGTPADCVKLGIGALLPKAPDLVFSGINRGANLGTDVLYSGTVSAAIEGVINGIPSMAISVTEYENPDFRYAAGFAAKIAKTLLPGDGAAPECTLININVPSEPPQGVKVTRLSSRRYFNVFQQRTDPRGGIYYWMVGEPQDSAPQNSPADADLDAEAIKNKYISVTPLHFDLTAYHLIPRLTGLLRRLPD
ncbi:MAG: 5'/3'-nucleotidase SurE [Firmicutes bacterium]|nr:5'/3'-nucleotidase SurE [Bacillota bacterium]